MDSQTSSHQKSHSQHRCNREQSRGSRTTPWEMGGLCPTLDTPVLRTCPGKIRPPQNIWVWKPVGLISRGPRVLQGSELLLFWGACLWSPWSWDPAQKQQLEKCQDSVKEIHLLILKYLPEGQGQVGTLGMEVLASHFCMLPTPC